MAKSKMQSSSKFDSIYEYTGDTSLLSATRHKNIYPNEKSTLSNSLTKVASKSIQIETFQRQNLSFE